jgi:hypothetical protein
MSLPSVAKGGAGWAHGLSADVLERVRELIQPIHRPATLALDPDPYARLYESPPSILGNLLGRYAIFQVLRRRVCESEADHYARQTQWQRERNTIEKEKPGSDAWRAWEPESNPAHGAWHTSFGCWLAGPDELRGSSLETLLSLAPRARVFVFDIAADKNDLMGRLSHEIDLERFCQGVAPRAARRGRKPARENPAREYGEFLRTIKEHEIVPLWDLQLAGFAVGKRATSAALYPEVADPGSPRRVARNYPTPAKASVDRALLQKIRRARELQDEAMDWVVRLSATGVTG